MVDLEAFPDSAILTTREVAKWLGTTTKAVLCMPLAPVNLLTRERRFLAGTVKAHILAKPGKPTLRLRRDGSFR
jgi:hypothetical protein